MPKFAVCVYKVPGDKPCHYHSGPTTKEPSNNGIFQYVIQWCKAKAINVNHMAGHCNINPPPPLSSSSSWFGACRRSQKVKAKLSSITSCVCPSVTEHHWLQLCCVKCSPVCVWLHDETVVRADSSSRKNHDALGCNGARRCLSVVSGKIHTVHDVFRHSTLTCFHEVSP